jgi:uncharacterized damage-inducible protein DinB
MKKSVVQVTILIVMMLGANSTFAQQGVKNQHLPAPPDTLSKEVLEAWNGIGGKLIEMAEEFPEDKYDYRPTPQVRSFAEVLLHIVGTSYIFTDQAQGKTLRPHDLNRKDYPTKASIVTALKQAYQEGANVIEAKGDKGISKAVPVVYSDQMVHLYDLGYSTAMHASEHYGQLVTYFRLNGIVPPETRKNAPQGNAPQAKD